MGHTEQTFSLSVDIGRVVIKVIEENGSPPILQIGVYDGAPPCPQIVNMVIPPVEIGVLQAALGEYCAAQQRYDQARFSEAKGELP